VCFFFQKLLQAIKKEKDEDKRAKLQQLLTRTVSNFVNFCLYFLKLLTRMEDKFTIGLIVQSSVTTPENASKAVTTFWGFSTTAQHLPPNLMGVLR